MGLFRSTATALAARLVVLVVPIVLVLGGTATAQSTPTTMSTEPDTARARRDAGTSTISGAAISNEPAVSTLTRSTPSRAQ